MKLKINYCKIDLIINNLIAEEESIVTLINSLNSVQNSLLEENEGESVNKIVENLSTITKSCTQRQNMLIEMRNSVIVYKESGEFYAYSEYYNSDVIIDESDVKKNIDEIKRSLCKNGWIFDGEYTNAIEDLKDNPGIFLQNDYKPSDHNKRVYSNNKQIMDDLYIVAKNIGKVFATEVQKMYDAHKFLKDMQDFDNECSKSINYSDFSIEEAVQEVERKKQIEYAAEQLTDEVYDYMLQSISEKTGLSVEQLSEFITKENVRDMLIEIFTYLDSEEGQNKVNTVHDIGNIITKYIDFSPFLSSPRAREISGSIMEFLGISEFFGFELHPDGTHYVTNETSLQSNVGFMTFYDHVGKSMGMELDTEIIVFQYGGQEYRVQLWEGTYGWRDFYGGEIGMYSRPVSEANKHPFVYGDKSSDFIYYHCLDDNNDIRTTKTFYSNKTGEPIISNSTTNYSFNGDSFWNLAIIPEKIPTGGIYTVDTLYFEDPGMANAFITELESYQNNHAQTEGFEYSVDTVGNTDVVITEVSITWDKE